MEIPVLPSLSSEQLQPETFKLEFRLSGKVAVRPTSPVFIPAFRHMKPLFSTNFAIRAAILPLSVTEVQRLSKHHFQRQASRLSQPRLQHLFQHLFQPRLQHLFQPREIPRPNGDQSRAFYRFRTQKSLELVSFPFSHLSSIHTDCGLVLEDPRVVRSKTLIDVGAWMLDRSLPTQINLPLDEPLEVVEEQRTWQVWKCFDCTLKYVGRRRQNQQAFLTGRQIFVATCMLLVVARIASPAYGKDDANIFSVSDGFQAFLNSGLTGAVITTIIGSLAWRIIASSFPLAFLSNPHIYVIIRICLIFGSCAICSGTWVDEEIVVAAGGEDFCLWQIS